MAIKTFVIRLNTTRRIDINVMSKECLNTTQSNFTTSFTIVYARAVNTRDIYNGIRPLLTTLN